MIMLFVFTSHATLFHMFCNLYVYKLIMFYKFVITGMLLRRRLKICLLLAQLVISHQDSSLLFMHRGDERCCSNKQMLFQKFL
ncbi:hypothetical protein Hdeb2414_s0012g00381561 [Helianthus debilis subsp. tardiflorus]